MISILFEELGVSSLGLKIRPEKSVLGDFFFSIKNLSINFCHFYLEKCVCQVSGLAIGPKAWLLQSVCLLVSKVAGYFYNAENYFVLSNMTANPSIAIDFSFLFPPNQFWKLQQQGFEEEKEADKTHRE